MTTITINEQILTGNLNEGFLLNDYMAELEQEWTALVLGDYPEANVVVNFDIQRASGSTRDMSVFIETDDGEYADGSDLIPWMENCSKKLAEQERFYE